jgi:uncharacterized protein with GYD domain
MSLYFLLGTLTTDGRAKVNTNRNLVVEAARKVSVAGAEILGQYAVLGRFDYLMMIEADDNDAVARLSLEMGVRTGMHIETLPGIPIGFLTDGRQDDPITQPESVSLSPPEV